MTPIATRTPRGWARLLARLALVGLFACMTTACGDYMHVVYGFMDAEGRWVVPPAYDDAYSFAEGVAAAKQGDRWGFIDARGRWVIPPTYESVTSFAEGRAGVSSDGERWSYIDQTGAVVIAGPFASASPFAGGIAAVEIDGKWGFVDHSGRQVVAPRFDELDETLAQDDMGPYVTCFSEGLCAASANDAWGYIDRRGEWVIEPRFAQAGRFTEGLARVREHAESGLGKVGFVDRTGAMVIPARFEDALWFSGGRAIAVVARGAPPTSESAAGAASEEPGKTVVLIDRSGRQVADVGWDELEGAMETVASFLELTAQDYLADGMIPASRDKLWGFMDRQGRWVIEPQFGLVLPFRDGRAVVMILGETGELLDDDARAGVIDTAGRWIVPPDLDAVGALTADQLAASLYERWGVLDVDGRWRIEPRYRDTGDALLSLPRAGTGTGGGLRRVGVTANHEWIVADRRGRVRGRRECEWLESVEVEVAGDGSLHSTRLACAQGEAWGLADLRLRPVVEPQFQDPPKRSDGLLVVKRQGRQGCIDDQGRVIVPVEFEDVAECTKQGAIAQRDRAWGTWDPAQGWQAWQAPKPESPDACESDDSTCEPVSTRTTWVHDGSHFVLVIGHRLAAGVAPADEVMVSVATGTSLDARTTIAHVRRGDRWGVIDEHGREWLPSQYDEIGRAHDGMVAARRGDRWQIVDARQRVVFDDSAFQLAPFNREVAIFRDGERYGLVARDGRVIVPAQHRFIEPLTRHEARFGLTAPVNEQSPQLAGVIDDAGRVRLPQEFLDIRVFSDTLWKAQGHNRKWNLVERSTGRRLPVSDRIVGMPDDVLDGLSATTLRRADGTIAIGHLDSDGRIAIEPQFDQAGTNRFANGVAIAWRDGRCGTIDRRGQPLVPLEYAHCQDIGDGLTIAARHVPWRDVRKPVSP